MQMQAVIPPSPYRMIYVGDPGYLTLNTAITALNGDGDDCTLIVRDGAHAVGANTTANSNIHLVVPKGADIQIATGVTLTINGSLDAGPYQIFSCTGTGKVVFGAGAVKEVCPEWWATNTTPGTTDMAAALQAAITCGQTSQIPVALAPYQTYAIGTGLTVAADYFTLRGDNSYIKATAAIQMIDIAKNTNYHKISGVRLNGGATGSSVGLATGGIRMGNTATTSNMQKVELHDVWVDHINGNGVEGYGVMQMVMAGCYVFENTGKGLYLGKSSNLNRIEVDNWFDNNLYNIWIDGSKDNWVMCDVSSSVASALLTRTINNVVIHGDVAETYGSADSNKIMVWGESTYTILGDSIKIYERSHGNIVEGSHLNDTITGQYAISIGDAADLNPCVGNRIVNNYFRMSQQTGHINLVNSIGALISGNLNKYSTTMTEPVITYGTGAVNTRVIAGLKSNDVETKGVSFSATPGIALYHIYAAAGAITVTIPHASVCNGEQYKFAALDVTNPITIQSEAVTGAISTINTTPVAAGAGYTVGDFLTLDVGTFGTVKVISVDGSGGVTGIRLVRSGSGYTATPTTFTTVGGTGSGCTVSVTAIFGANSIITPSGATSMILPAVGNFATLMGSNNVWNLVDCRIRRNGAASPSGTYLPYFIGEEFEDTTAHKWYKAIAPGTANTDWVALN